MNDDPKNGGRMVDDTNKQAQQLQIPEGDRFLFVRMGQDGAVQILFSSAENAVALHHIAGRWLDLNLIDPTVAPQAKSAMPAGLDMSSLQRAMKRSAKT